MRFLKRTLCVHQLCNKISSVSKPWHLLLLWDHLFFRNENWVVFFGLESLFQMCYHISSSLKTTRQCKRWRLTTKWHSVVHKRNAQWGDKSNSAIVVQIGIVWWALPVGGEAGHLSEAKWGNLKTRLWKRMKTMHVQSFSCYLELIWTIKIWSNISVLVPTKTIRVKLCTVNYILLPSYKWI